MGQVAAVIRVMPAQDIDFEAMKKKVEETLEKYENMREEPIAFGLKALKVTVVVEDGEGGLDGIENSLKSLDEVESAEVTDMGRLM